MSQEPFPHPSNGFSNIDEDTCARLKAINRMKVKELEEDIGLQWQSPVNEKYREGDIKSMRRAALPGIQYKLISLVHTAESEQVALQAAQMVMAQEGEGPVQKVEQVLNFRQMPVEQLQSMVTSKLAKLEKLVPGFSLETMLQEARKRIGSPDEPPPESIPPSQQILDVEVEYEEILE